MSHWTYVNGTINVEIPFNTCNRKTVENYILWSIKQIRIYGIDITGSEGSVHFYTHCGYHPSCYSSETADTWDYGYITVMGSLRDREDEQTVKETEAFLRRLEHFVRITNINITVSGDNKHLVNSNIYSKIHAFDDDWEKNEKYRDKLYNIQLKNSHRFFDTMLTLEKATEMAEIITHVSPDTLEGLLCNFGVERTIDWDFTDSRKDWFRSHKINLQDPNNSHYREWYYKRKSPKKVTLQDLENELDELAYGEKQYDFTVQEHKKITKLRNVVQAAKQNEEIKENIEKWD